MGSIVPRSVIGTPEPPASRPRLSRVGVVLAHEVGVGLPKTSRYRSADPADVLRDARSAASYGVSSNRPWEYGHMIGLDGTIFEQGGKFRQAHCLNFNHASDSVLFLNALDVPCNPAQIDSWHWLRAYQVERGVLAADHVAAPHYRYRSTSCPGLRAEPPGGAWFSPTGEGRLGELIPALLDPPTVPAPRPRGDISMVILDYTNPKTGQWTALTFTGTHLAHTGGHADQVLRTLDVPRRPINDAQLDAFIESAATTTDPPPEFSSARKAAWTASRG